jgi:MFS transporter, DHA2 family, multidrug resistance protein
LCAGILLAHFWWGSVFLLTLPLALIALVMAVRLVPSHVNEGSEPVDHVGGVLSIALVGALILGINFAAVPNETTLILSLFIVTATALVAFVIRQRRARNPLYDLHVAARPTFWVAACAGLIVFGSLMGAMFIGQQFLQNVLGYSTVDAGLAILPAAVFMVLGRAAVGQADRGPRGALHAALRLRVRAAGLPHDTAPLEGEHLLLEGRARLLVRRDRRRACGDPGLAFAHGLSPGDARGHGFRNRRPPAQPRRGDHAVDLRSPPDRGLRIRGRDARHLVGQGRLEQHGGGADEVVLERRRSRVALSTVHSGSDRRGGENSLLQGDQWAYLAGIIAVLLGGALVAVFFPRAERERQLLAAYQSEDAAAAAKEASELSPQVAPT